MWECLIGVRHRGCPVSDTSAELTSLSIQNVSKVDDPEGFGRRLLYVTGDASDLDQFETVCRSHDRVVDLELISENAGTEAYYTLEIEYDESTPSILSIINEHGSFHTGVISVQRGNEHWLLHASNKETISDITNEIEAHDNTVTLSRMVDLEKLGHMDYIKHNVIISRLTARQQTTFRTALDLGYYENDSDVIVSDIAEELDRHDTTTWEHLNKAENTILTAIGERLFSSHGLDSAN